MTQKELQEYLTEKTDLIIRLTEQRMRLDDSQGIAECEAYEIIDFVEWLAPTGYVKILGKMVLDSHKWSFGTGAIVKRHLDMPY